MLIFGGVVFLSLRIRLYVLRNRFTPSKSYSFRMGLEPQKSYSIRRGSGFLGYKHQQCGDFVIFFSFHNIRDVSLHRSKNCHHDTLSLKHKTHIRVTCSMSSQRGKGAKITGVTILDENITVKELENFLYARSKRSIEGPSKGWQFNPCC